MNSSLQRLLDFDFLARHEIEARQHLSLRGLLSEIMPSDAPCCTRRSIHRIAVSDHDLMHFFESLPVTDKIDHGALLEHFDHRDAGILFASSGSTGAPKLIWLRFDDMLVNTRFHGKGYFTAGIRAADRVLTYGHRGFMDSEYTVYLALSQTGCMIFPLAAFRPATNVIDICERYRVTVLLVMPSDLIPLVDALEEQHRRLPSIRLVVTGGEPLCSLLKTRIRQTMGNDSIVFRSTFQTSQVGTLGFQCPFLNDDEYHIHEELQLIEVKSERDELITTNLFRHCLPIIRTKTGDRAQILGSDCPCGRKVKTIRLLGRVDDFVKIGGELFDVGIFDAAFKKHNCPKHLWQIKLARNDRAQDCFHIHLDRSISSSTFQEKLRTSIIAGSEKLQRQIEVGAVAPLQFHPLTDEKTKFTFSGKMQRFIDMRNHQSRCD
jgi:phenylacetate-coenzyme A ligase PaaK-like adenylate-forming protein